MQIFSHIVWAFPSVDDVTERRYEHRVQGAICKCSLTQVEVMYSIIGDKHTLCSYHQDNVKTMQMNISSVSEHSWLRNPLKKKGKEKGKKKIPGEKKNISRMM